MFLDEIMELLRTLIPKYNNILLLGNFNMHIEDTSNADNIIFMRQWKLWASFNMLNHPHIDRETS